MCRLSLGGINVQAVVSRAGLARTMKTVAILGLKAANGGLFVVAFALVSEVLKPKRFAGLFSAAPSVALANLAVVVAIKGHAEAIASTRGMVIGALAFTASAGSRPITSCVNTANHSAAKIKTEHATTRARIVAMRFCRAASLAAPTRFRSRRPRIPGVSARIVAAG